MNKVGISTASFFTKVLTEDTFSLIKELGGDCAEVFMTTNYEYTDEFGKIMQDNLHGLEIYSVHSLNSQYEPQLFNIAERTRRDAMVPFRNVIARAVDLGAHVYTFHGQARLKKDMKLNDVRVGEVIEKLNQEAMQSGVRIGFENVAWAAFNQPEVFNIIKEKSPSVGAVLDVKQAWRSGRDWREYIDVMGDRLINVHLCDHDENMKTCVVGKGVFDFKALITYLKDKGYKGPLLIEQYAGDYSSFDELGEAVDYIKKLVEEVYAFKI